MIRVHLRWCAAALIMIFVCKDVPAQAPSSAVNTSAIKDPKAKAAVEQIQKLIAGIREYTCTVQTSTALPKGSLSMTEQFWCKPPVLLNVQANREHPVATVRGNTTFYYSDGKTLVLHQKPGPGAMAAFTEMFSKSGRASADQVQRMASDAAKPKAFRYDLAKLGAAGMKTDGLFYSEHVMKPFSSCNMETVMLESETADAWTLSAVYNYPGGQGKSSLVIGKKDGAVRSIVTDSSAGKTTVAISGLQINPAAGIPAATFQYTPPPGVTVTDNTDAFIQQKKR